MRVTSLLICLFGLTSLAAADTPTFSETDWPWWRGQTRQGVAFDTKTPPLHWSETENVVWKTPLPGRGHGAPILLGDRVYLITADKQQRKELLLCLDRETGKQVWETVVHEGEFFRVDSREPNQKASWASSTPATDGKRIFVNFYCDKAVYTSAVTLDGEMAWQTKVCDYQIHQGFGSSPAIYENLVIASADNKSGGSIVAMDRETGEVVWRRERPQQPNYASPIILNVAGKDQLFMTGCDLVTSLDPMTGKTNWEIDGSTTECVTSTVTDGKHIFTSGGYPKNHVAAVNADGSGKVEWEVNTRDYVPSMLEKDGYLYMSLDAGVATCVNAADGETMWKSRLGGEFTASPVLVGDLIYATNEDSETFIFKATPEDFEKVATNKLSGTTFSTPVISDGKLYLRVAKDEAGKKQEYLYCIGE
ncbi:PQQ-binding-like beta-propeller repeat protein [Rhodopirellula sp. MGV]|uniref:outer membrane protein assembly factor BamB family protein n=1 Tax=Rhodopirellula sp. MGV TaxID=2023130 RepID=UPI000B9759B4|nr:PQQ-binding-like beta-propeller repeat protein [Rhodopirellula sp. MGV]OYP28374.1 serine/threonine protein kinase [Rhodopirellula sp. MGV]PNY38750.1 serine/threonine protein kinase [Rhodopirellula baltica]